MLATDSSGALQPIQNCSINIPGSDTIEFYSLPEITDSKSAAYSDEPVIGRSFPIKTYSHSENRTISMSIHFFLTTADDMERVLSAMRAIESAVYPRDGSGNVPYIPPPVCQLQCGLLLGDGPVCAVLRSYSTKFPTDVVWYEESEGNGNFLPVKFDVETTWEVVYQSSNLPGQRKIATSGV